jgi:glycolate oxidase FAD binding subunit
VVRGSGSKLDWGSPPRRLDVLLDLSAMNQVIDHAAGDLVLEAEAGCAFATLQDRLARHGQQLALDAPGRATVGGVIATGACGGRRLGYGSVRDLLIGITVARPDGTLASAGGRVVKNVAGYDLAKLLVGSYGTLGVITRAVFRLHPLPAATGILRGELDPAALPDAVAALVHSQLVPVILEVEAAENGPFRLTVAFEGSPAGVQARLARASVLATMAGLASSATQTIVAGAIATETIEGTYPQPWITYQRPPGWLGLKLTATLSRLPTALTVARDTARQLKIPLRLRASAGVGVAYLAVPHHTGASQLTSLLRSLRETLVPGTGSAVLLAGPAWAKAGIDVWGPIPALELMRRVKAEFDPSALLAPGRFVGGI